MFSNSSGVQSVFERLRDGLAWTVGFSSMRLFIRRLSAGSLCSLPLARVLAYDSKVSLLARSPKYLRRSVAVRGLSHQMDIARFAHTTKSQDINPKIYFPIPFTHRRRNRRCHEMLLLSFGKRLSLNTNKQWKKGASKIRRLHVLVYSIASYIPRFSPLRGTRKASKDT